MLAEILNKNRGGSRFSRHEVPASYPVGAPQDGAEARPDGNLVGLAADPGTRDGPCR